MVEEIGFSQTDEKLFLMIKKFKVYAKKCIFPDNICALNPKQSFVDTLIIDC